MVSGTFYLYRKRVLTPSQVPTMRHVTYHLNTHFRKIHPLPQLLLPDSPSNRITTQPDSDRTPFLCTYKPVVMMNEGSGRCCS